MDIKKTLLAPAQQSKPIALAVAEYAISGEEEFSELITCFLSTDYRLAQRAAWSLNMACDLDPSYINPYLSVLMKQLQREDSHPAVLRNTLRILSEVDLPEQFHGSLMTHCFDYIGSNQAAIAVKAYALAILHKLSVLYPDIRPELEVSIRERMEIETAAFRSRAKRILKSFAK